MKEIMETIKRDLFILNGNIENKCLTCFYYDYNNTFRYECYELSNCPGKLLSYIYKKVKEVKQDTEQKMKYRACINLERIFDLGRSEHRVCACCGCFTPDCSISWDRIFDDDCDIKLIKKTMSTWFKDRG